MIGARVRLPVFVSECPRFYPPSNKKGKLYLYRKINDFYEKKLRMIHRNVHYDDSTPASACFWLLPLPHILHHRTLHSSSTPLPPFFSNCVSTRKLPGAALLLCVLSSSSYPFHSFFIDLAAAYLHENILAQRFFFMRFLRTPILSFLSSAFSRLRRHLSAAHYLRSLSSSSHPSIFFLAAAFLARTY